MNDIDEFEKYGFIRSTRSSGTINKLRLSHGEYFRIFKSSIIDTMSRNPKYSACDVFGETFVFCYDERREQEFINFLVDKFYEKNPQPSRGVRTAFTRILHQHNLCWQGCHHPGKKAIGKEK